MEILHIGTLRAYEVLKGLTHGTGSKVEALLAFMEPELAANDGKTLSAGQLVELLNKNEWLSITEDALLDIIPNIKNKGWIEEVVNSTTLPTFKINCHRPPVPNQVSVDIVHKLTDRFSKFLKSIRINDGRIIENKELLCNSLIEWLLTADTTDFTALSTWSKGFEQAGDQAADQMDYLCARFVEN